MVKDLGRILAKTNALQFGTFTLTTGKLSSYYIDLRMVPSFPDVFKKTVAAYRGLLKEIVGLENVDAICGVPSAGIPFASALAYDLAKPLIYVRSEVRNHGTQKRIEGSVQPGWRVVVLDDLATTGSSIANVAEVVRSEGCQVNDAVVLIDRMEGGKENLAKIQVKLTSLTTILELADLLHAADLIDRDQRHAILKQIRSAKAAR